MLQYGYNIGLLRITSKFLQLRTQMLKIALFGLGEASRENAGHTGACRHTNTTRVTYGEMA